MAFGVGLFFSIQTRDARGSEGTARVPKAPPLPPRPPWAHQPHAGDVQLPAQPSLPGLGAGKEQSHPGCKKGEAQRGS